MKNYNFTSLSFLQQHNPGLDGFQSIDSDISMMVGNNINGYTGIDDTYSQQLNYGSMDVPSQFPCFSPAMYSSFMPTPIDNIALASPPPPLADYQCSLPFDSIKTDTIFLQPCESIMKDEGKYASGGRLGQTSNVMSSTTRVEASGTSKKRKAIEQLTDVQQLKAPFRKSQKLSDKITALQELVSPYGKTDTASVLQEACIYIKIIHQEIRRLSISYFEARSLHSQLQGDAERQADLRSKGLCLVPVGIMKSLARESWSDQHQDSSRSFRSSRNF